MDLNDGSLQKQYEAYKEHLDFAGSVGLNVERSDVTVQLTSVSSYISDDLDFIHSSKKGLECLLIFNYLSPNPGQYEVRILRETAV